MSKIKKLTQQGGAVTDNAWQELNIFTDARIGLGRAGISLPTKHLLAFQLAHAKAQDAVHTPLDSNAMAEQLRNAPWSVNNAPFLLHSQTKDRASYLQRPDQGRLLDDKSAYLLDQHRDQNPQDYDLVIAVVDGLSALAIEQNALPFLNALFTMPLFQKQSEDDITANNKTDTQTKTKVLHIAPICIVKQGRVAVGDDICQRLSAKCVLVLIGERPGLSSPDSMGLYLTWGGKVGCTDAYRNCISNIRPAGLTYPDAAQKTYYLITEARAQQLTGVRLKDRSEIKNEERINHRQNNFLIT